MKLPPVYRNNRATRPGVIGITFMIGLSGYFLLHQESNSEVIGKNTPVSLTTELPAFDVSPGPTTTTTISVEISTSDEPIFESPVPTTGFPTTTKYVSPVPTAAPVITEPTDDIWWKLALCEDGGNNRWFPPYSGYFHFLPNTWWNIGAPSGYPHEYDYETQKHWAQVNQRLSGWGQWPGCARQLGLI